MFATPSWRSLPYDRGCPRQCSADAAQHTLSEGEIRSFPDFIRKKIEESGWPCRRCECCGAVYIHERFLDVLLDEVDAPRSTASDG
ncbi:MAG TPA: hypothetical protein VFB54_18520 [Burkholderiales bacterium]|nr:hypothetical protein [Burkholderiales bacterium]